MHTLEKRRIFTLRFLKRVQKQFWNKRAATKLRLLHAIDTNKPVLNSGRFWGSNSHIWVHLDTPVTCMYPVCVYYNYTLIGQFRPLSVVGDARFRQKKYLSLLTYVVQQRYVRTRNTCSMPPKEQSPVHFEARAAEICNTHTASIVI